MTRVGGKRIAPVLLAAWAASASIYQCAAAVPSFSGADGAGAATTGGRGGIVYHVTKLDASFSDTGIGTLHYGLNDSNFAKDASGNVQPRTIVFDVGGTIWLGNKATDTEGWNTQDPMSAGSQNNLSSNITIAGQTAPGGINIVGGGLKVNGANVIVRNLFIAPGYGNQHVDTFGFPGQFAFDGMNIHANNVMVDHLSTVFATDEGISADEVANNVTLQYNNISQGQNFPQADAETPNHWAGHALGSLWQPGTNAKTSIIHNLYANEAGRLPRVGSEVGTGALNDFRNNVFYNWINTGGTGSAGQPSFNNFVANYYLAGPGGEVPQDPVVGSGNPPIIITQGGGTTVFDGKLGPTGVFQSGNLLDSNKNGTPEFAGTGTKALGTGDYPNSVYPVGPYAVPFKGVTQTAQAAFTQVTSYVGANWQTRNSIDASIIAGVMNGTGTIQAWNDPTHGTAWNSLLALRAVANGGVAPFSRAANFDTDADGMPDTWELAHALNPAVADNNGDYDNNGFTNLEEYLNELGAFPADSALVFSNANNTSRFAEIGNWGGVFQPSRYDEAQINAGTVVVDAVGQHAGTLKIAANAGNSATLSVTTGWIDIAQSLLVGPGGSGQVNQTGGIVHAASSVVIGGTNNAGAYNLSAGTLSTPLLTRGAQGGTFNFTGGTLHAKQVTFDLVDNGGIIAPGSDTALQLMAAAGMPDINNNLPAIESNIGNTHVNGNLTLNSGTVQIEIASLSSIDTLTIDGTAALGGTLDVEPINGFVPLPGERWQIMNATAYSGSFSLVTPGFFVQQVGTALFIATVPEPASVVLVAISGLLLVRPRRKVRGVGH